MTASDGLPIGLMRADRRRAAWGRCNVLPLAQSHVTVCGAMSPLGEESLRPN